MKTYYLPIGYEIFMCICAVGSFVFVLSLVLKFIKNMPADEAPAIVFVCLVLMLLSLLFIAVHALHSIFTGKIKTPYCYISEQGFQFYRSAVIPWSQIEKVVFVKSVLWDEAWDDEWVYAYLVLRPNGEKRYILANRFYFNFFGCGAVLADMKQEFTKYIPVEIK